MTRLEKELRNRGIVFDADDMMIAMHGIEYDMDEHLVTITGDFIITRWSSAVLDSELRIYDRRTFEMIGSQDLFPSFAFNGGRTWHSYGCTEEVCYGF